MQKQPGAIFMQAQKNCLTNYSNEYKLRSKVIQMHNNFTKERGNADAAMRGVFCAAAVVAEAYLWPCVRGGLTVCADCFDTLVSGLSRRELAARLGAPGV